MNRTFRRALLSIATILALTAWTWRWRIVDPTPFPSYLPATLDLFYYFYPMLEVGYSRLHDGHLFLWNAYQGCGMPGLATLQAGFLYPPHLVYLFLPTATGMAVMAFCHTVMAAFAMMFLGRTLNLGWLAAMAGAVGFAFCGVLARLGWPSGMEAAAWLPFGVAAIVRIGVRGERRWTTGLVIAVAMPMLTGGYQTVAIYYCYALFIVTIFVERLWIQRAPLRSLFPLAGAFAVGIAAGILLAAPQVLPTLELSRLGERATANPLAAQVNGIFGNPWSSAPVLWSALFVPPRSFLELETYVGVVAGVLAVLGLIHARRWRWPLAVILGFGLLSLSGPAWFLSFRGVLPAIHWFRLPFREFILAQFAVGVLVAFGVDFLTTMKATARSVSLAAVIVVVTAAAMVFPMVHVDAHVIAAAAAIVVLVILVPFAGQGVWRSVAIVAVLILLVWDNVAVPRNYDPLPYMDGQWQSIHHDRDLHRELADMAGYDRVFVPVEDAAVKHPMLFGTFSPIDYDPLVITGFRKCLDYAMARNPDEQTMTAPFLGIPAKMAGLLTSPGRRCLDLVSVRFAAVPFALSLDPEVQRQWTPSSRVLPSVPAGLFGAEQRYVPFVSPNAVSRAYGVYTSECLGPENEQYQRILDPAFDPHGEVVLEDGPTCVPLAAGKQGYHPPSVRITHHEDEEIRIEGEFSAPGYVVLTDSFYPGWTAKVNGHDTEIFKANAMSRAVKVPAGKVSVVIRYRPESFYAGCGLALVGVLLALGYSVIGRNSLPTKAARLS